MGFPELSGAEGLPESANICSVLDKPASAGRGTEECGIGWTNRSSNGRGTEERAIGYERGMATK